MRRNLNIYKNMVVNTEDQDCYQLAGWLGQKQTDGVIPLFTHVANETYTPYRSVRNRNTMMGVKPGIQDYIVVLPDEVLFIEMKRLKGGSLTPNQKAWQEAVNGKPIVSTVCYGLEEAKTFIKSRINK